MAIYMKFPDAKGNVTTKGFEGWIELYSVEYGVSRNIQMVAGKSSDRESGRPTLTSIKIMKTVDEASSILFQAATVGKAADSVEIVVCATDDEMSPILKYVLTDVIVSSRSIQVTEHDAPMVSLSLSYTSIEETVIPRDSSNKSGSPVTSGYDLVTAQAK